MKKRRIFLRAILMASTLVGFLFYGSVVQAKVVTHSKTKDDIKITVKYESYKAGNKKLVRKGKFVKAIAPAANQSFICKKSFNEID